MISRSLRQRLRRPSRTGLPACFLDSFVVFLLTCVLIFPLFILEYLVNWGSIESKTIADSRMLRENFPHIGWQPLWYCGTRFDYIYPPAVRYGTALVSWLLHLSIAHAYHLYIAVVYALGIAGVYWLVYSGSGSRAQAWVGAIASAVLSPSLWLMASYRHDNPDWVPERLHVLMSYGEGPHVTAVSMLAVALAASFAALRRSGGARLFGAGVLCATVISSNFYGAVGLAMFFAVLVWAVWLELRRPDVWLRAACIAAVAYGLCAFWFTPSYVRMTLVNLNFVALPRTPWSGTIAAACVLVFCAVTYRIGKRPAAWPIFVFGAAFFTSIYVLGAYRFGFTVAGNGVRFVPELDLALILPAVYAAALVWRRPLLRSGLIVLACFACYPALHYMRHAWTIFPQASSSASRCEFQIADWMHSHAPGTRALASGSVRFWYEGWHNNAQVHGASDEGMLNQLLPAANWEITQGTDANAAILWLQALGAGAVIVPYKNSQEVYHDYVHPEKFQGVLPAIFDDHQGNVIYGVHRRFPAIARVVDRASVDYPVTPGTLPRYVAAIEHGPDSEVLFKRLSFNAVDLTATTNPGEAVLFQETFDRGWHAYADGHPLRITRDPMDFMLVEAPSGRRTIQMRFETPLENRIGWIITGLTLASAVVFLWVCK